jgi:putative FmdB family regulatory protein
MPLYEYECDNGHVSEELFSSFSEAPNDLTCLSCFGTSRRIVSLPSFKVGWKMVVNDSGRVWDGTPLEGTDGVNELYYKSKKPQFDMAGKAKKDVTVSSTP